VSHNARKKEEHAHGDERTGGSAEQGAGAFNPVARI
jgi:hypothetical protein